VAVTASPSAFWPAGLHGAVSLTFDDGRASQLERVIPILDEYGLLGTFYLNPRGRSEDDWRSRLAPWAAVQQTGHEIGNHSLSHVCAQSMRDRADPARPSLETWTVADVEADVLEAERRLDAVLPAPQGQPRSFCYPCYQDFVGVGSTRQSYVPMIARHFTAARGGGEYGSNYPDTCDLHYLWSWKVELLDGAALVGRCEKAARGSWEILTFHDVGANNRLNNTEADFRELCAYLARSRDRLWTAPVAVVAAHVRRQRAAGNGPQA
jgi:peptidoglycan-N-acetylglucosamine deacetylase